MKIKMTFLGTGTSVGVPMLCCNCETCRSEDPRDTRLRASVLLEWEGATVVIDTTPEFRLQMLRAGDPGLDAVLFTHNHADHIHGLDDIRPYCLIQKKTIPLYGAPHIIKYLQHHFDYIWNHKQKGGGLPKVDLRPVTDTFEYAGVAITPIPVMHGVEPIYGYRIGDLAYISDVSEIPPASMKLLKGLRYFVVDAVRYAPHSTHFHVDKAIEVAQEVGAETTYFTHMNHEILHARFEQDCPPGMTPAYDGLTLDVTA